MAGAKRLEELAAWRLADDLKRRVYDLCRRPAVVRDYRFREQLRDSAASATRNIAEGFGRFRHGDFAKFARIGKASELEVLNHLRDAVDRGYLSEPELRDYERAVRRALSAVNGLIQYLESTPDPK